jgi:hypothetical protein
MKTLFQFFKNYNNMTQRRYFETPCSLEFCLKLIGPGLPDFSGEMGKICQWAQNVTKSP